MGKATMQTYLTLDGLVLDLSGLPTDQQAFFDRCVTAYENGMSWLEISRLVEGLENPLLRPTGGFVTLAIWKTPLFQAVSDIEGRLGIRHGDLLPDPGDTSDRDPFADEWLSLDEAAARKGVTVQKLKQAIAHRSVIATRPEPGQGPRRVSANSLARWAPKPGSRDAVEKPARRRAS